MWGRLGLLRSSLLSVLALVALLGCAGQSAVGGPAGVAATPSPAPEPASPTPRATKPADCPQIESRLYDLMIAADPARAAADLGLAYADGRVRVIVELADATSATPQHPDLVVEGRFSNLVQGRVPPAALCALSRLPDVRFVRGPAVAVPGAAAQPTRP